MADFSISVVILTYNRLEELRCRLSELSLLAYPRLQVIVVDNCSEIPASSLAEEFPRVNFIRSPGNIGTGGRNIGISQANGEIAICLDDDVGGLTDDALLSVCQLFEDASLGGVCFKVIEATTDRITNWVHHRSVEDFAETSFETYEITEGAVAFRRDVAISAGLYPESFFISHEGPDLAFRIMELGYRVIYTPTVTVRHAECTGGGGGTVSSSHQMKRIAWLQAAWGGHAALTWAGALGAVQPTTVPSGPRSPSPTHPRGP